MLRRASPLPSVGVVFAFALALFATRCAKSECSLNSDCHVRQFCDLNNLCRQDCAQDRDCTDGYCDPNGRCVAGPKPDAAPDDVPEDASDDVDDQDGPDVTPPVDRVVPVDMAPPVDRVVPVDVPPIDMQPLDMPPPVDLPTPIDMPPPVDVPPIDMPPVDLPPPPDVPHTLAGLLDPCVIDSDCTSRVCAGAVGASLCTRTCTSRRDCLDGYLCAAGRCVPDDTGTPCDPTATRVTCAFSCFGNSASRAGHCTRQCSSGADCPASYACALVSGMSVCVEVEHGCNRAADCDTNLCLATFRACTAQCRTAADCPRRMTVDDGTGRLVTLPPYTCTMGLCAPPFQALGGDLLGADPIGSMCSATAPPTCYSGVCDTGDSMTAPTCVQGCTPTGGCPSGFACRTWLPDGASGGIYLVCRPGGSGPLGSTCAHASDCATALCLGTTATTGYCTRFCNDGACPTGMGCTPSGSTVDGTPIAICTR